MKCINSVSRLGWLGKEKDLESGLGDHGARKYDACSGRFLSVDPQPHVWVWEKYLSWSPYQYSANNPVNYADVNGKNAYLLTWTSGGANGPGHSVIGIDNYDSKGVANGTVTLFDLVPAVNVGAKEMNITSNVKASYRMNTINNNDLKNLDYETFSINSNGDNPNGVLEIITSGQSIDNSINQNLRNSRQNNNYYNGANWNCSHYAQEGLRGINSQFGAFEYINYSLLGFVLFKGVSVTPNFLFKRTQTSFKSNTLKDPGDSVDQTFEEAIR